MRGRTRYFIGSVESVVSASICSVTRMVPSSAAIEEATRPGDHQAAEHGAELADDADGDDRGHDGAGVEAVAAGPDLQRQRARR